MLAALAVAAALAQTAPTIAPEFKVTPKRAGTKAEPRNALVHTKGTIAGGDPVTLSRIEYTIPRRIRIDGAGFPTCSVDFINASGDAGCPKGSRVGGGGATAELGPERTPLVFDVDVYVAGPKRLTIYLQGIFNLAFPGEIEGRVVGFDLPESVQQPVPGLYAYVTSVTASLGSRRARRSLAVTTGCRKGRHAGRVKVFLAPNPDPPPVPSLTVAATSRCQRA